MADALTSHSSEIVQANLEDLAKSKSEGLSNALMSRLKLNEEKLKVAIDGVRKVALLPDPVGHCQLRRELYESLVLERISVPLGVLGFDDIKDVLGKSSK